MLIKRATLINCRNLQSESVHGTHRVLPGLIDMDWIYARKCRYPVEEAEVCTEAAILY
jgi:hypothetical protein